MLTASENPLPLLLSLIFLTISMSSTASMVFLPSVLRPLSRAPHIIVFAISLAAFPGIACPYLDQSLSYKILSSNTSHFMSINGGSYFPCWQHKDSVGNTIWVCGKKDLFGFFGLGNSVKFNYEFTQVFDNRGSYYDLYWRNATNYSLKDCTVLPNGKLKLIYEQYFETSLIDKQFSQRLVKEQVVKSYRPSLNISQ